MLVAAGISNSSFQKSKSSAKTLCETPVPLHAHATGMRPPVARQVAEIRSQVGDPLDQGSLRDQAVALHDRPAQNSVASVVGSNVLLTGRRRVGDGSAQWCRPGSCCSKTNSPTKRNNAARTSLVLCELPSLLSLDLPNAIRRVAQKVHSLLLHKRVSLRPKTRFIARMCS